MAAGQRAGAHAGEFEGDDGLRQQGDDPADGTDEARTALAGPVHGLGEVEAEDDAGEGFGQDVVGVAARHLLQIGVVLALGGGLHLHVFGADALLAGEAGDGLRGGGFRRTEHALLAIGLSGGEAFGAQHEASRGGIEADGIVGDFELLKGEAQVFERRRESSNRGFPRCRFRAGRGGSLGGLQQASFARLDRLTIGPQVGNLPTRMRLRLRQSRLRRGVTGPPQWEPVAGRPRRRRRRRPSCARAGSRRRVR